MKTLIILFVLLLIAAAGCADQQPQPPFVGAWLDMNTSRYAREPMRTENGVFYRIDQHTVSFGKDGAWHDAYVLDVLAWQYDGQWSSPDDGAVITWDDRETVLHSYSVDGNVMFLDGYRYEWLDESGIPNPGKQR